VIERLFRNLAPKASSLKRGQHPTAQEEENMICHHHKCIFVHIPKTAGQSIECVFLQLLGLTWETRAPLLLRFNDRKDLGPPRLAHLKAREYLRYRYISKELFNFYFKFSIVRNPWSRIVSFYKYKKYYRICTFKNFVMKHLEKKIQKDHWFFGPQFDFIHNENGDIIVNFVGKFENINNDFRHICNSINIPEINLPHVNKSKTNKVDIILENLNLLREKNKPSYPDYYDHETKEYVAHLYKDDITCFQYKFESK
jgi:hypothetical protein